MSSALPKRGAWNGRGCTRGAGVASTCGGAGARTGRLRTSRPRGRLRRRRCRRSRSRPASWSAPCRWGGGECAGRADGKRQAMAAGPKIKYFARQAGRGSWEHQGTAANKHRFEGGGPAGTTLAGWFRHPGLVCAQVLRTSCPRGKAALTHRAWLAYNQGGLPLHGGGGSHTAPPDRPARPDKPRLVPPKEVRLYRPVSVSTSL